MTARTTSKCAVNGCRRDYYGRGWCFLHYRRVWESGSVEGRGHSGRRDRALALTPLGHAVLAIPPQLFDAGYTVLALIPLTDLSALTGVQG